MENNDFTMQDLILSFKDLELSEKRREFGRELAEATVVIQKLLNDISEGEIPIDLDRFNNLYDGQSTEDEYLTGLYEDFLTFKELLAMYLSKTTEIYYEDV